MNDTDRTALVAARRGELLTRPDFPADLWQAFARRGLMGLGLPAATGGRGGT